MPPRAARSNGLTLRRRFRGLIPALRRLPIKRAKRPHLPNRGYYRNHRFAMQFRFLTLFTVLARIVI
jgi:hypothetical protein